MQTRQFILSFFAIVIFFILATATSQDENLLPIVNLNLTAEISDTNLILTNNDTLDIENAFMVLHQPTGDSTSAGMPNVRIFTQQDYVLSAGNLDTIALSEFKIGAETYPVDTMPIFFQLQSFSTFFEGIFEQAF